MQYSFFTRLLKQKTDLMGRNLIATNFLIIEFIPTRTPTHTQTKYKSNCVKKRTKKYFIYPKPIKKDDMMKYFLYAFQKNHWPLFSSHKKNLFSKLDYFRLELLIFN